MSKNTSPPASGAGFEKFLEAMGKGLWLLVQVCYYGIKKVNVKTVDFWILSFFIGVSCAHLAWASHLHVWVFHKVWPALFTDNVVTYLLTIKPNVHFWFLICTTVTAILFALGIKEYRRIGKMKRAISDLGFQNKSGTRPKILEIKTLGDGKSKLTVFSGGFGVDRFESRKSDLSAAFGQIIEQIQVDPDNLSNVEVFLCERDLPKRFNFSESKELLKTPYTFVVGQSYKGPIVQSIRTLPHMFIAGTTGGGKSVFFNNLILSLMHTSERIRFYLIDLKNGLEVQDYKDFPKVEIAKNEEEAVDMLDDLNGLMDKRFKHLEEKKRRNIEPEKDKKDIIIVAFDEVSEAFDTSTTDEDKKKLRQRIVDKAHRLSKLSRAAGFNMIFATQKIKKQLLPT